MSKPSIDPQCQELAAHFMADYGDILNRHKLVQELAEVIQHAADDWLADFKRD